MMFSRRKQTQKCANARGKQPSNHNRSRGKTSRAPPLPIPAGPPVHPFSFRPDFSSFPKNLDISTTKARFRRSQVGLRRAETAFQNSETPFLSDPV